MIINDAGTYTLKYTATDECGKTSTVDRELIVNRVPVVSWADGTDEEIVAMVKAADRGSINLADYWSVGDERVVRLSAMEDIGTGSPHAEQDVTFVLMNVGGKTLNAPTQSGRTECSFIVGMKDSLNEYMGINSTNINDGGWELCTRRTWCNSVFYNAIPSGLRPIFKQCLNKTWDGRGTTTSTESVDYFALAAEYEIFGGYTYSSSVYETGLTQFEWYQTASNRIKKSAGSDYYWWERSPRSENGTEFCLVNATGGATRHGAYNKYGISPFGTI